MDQEDPSVKDIFNNQVIIDHFKTSMEILIMQKLLLTLLILFFSHATYTMEENTSTTVTTINHLPKEIILLIADHLVNKEAATINDAFEDVLDFFITCKQFNNLKVSFLKIPEIEKVRKTNKNNFRYKICGFPKKKWQQLSGLERDYYNTFPRRDVVRELIDPNTIISPSLTSITPQALLSTFLYSLSNKMKCKRN